MAILPQAQFNFKLNKTRGFNSPLFLSALNSMLKGFIDMKELEDLSRRDLLESLEAEVAKSLNELRSAQGDLDKINGRLRFALAAIHIAKGKKE
jgi:hypothetical protein